MQTLVVKIRSWEKYNKRKDIKRPHWFALSNTILEDPDLFNLTNGEMLAYIYILCQASKKQSDEISINLTHAQKVSNIKQSDMLNAIEKLNKLQILIDIRTESVQNPYGSVRDPNASVRHTTLQDTTLHNKTIQNNAHFEMGVRVFNDLYKSYPKKIGKAKGLARLKTQLKSDEDINNFNLAVKNYCNYCSNNAIEQRFIKHFSTFVNEWQDWLDPETGNHTNFAKKSKVDFSFLEKYKDK